MVRKLNSWGSQIKNGGRSPQSKQDPSDRHSEQLAGVRGRVELPRGLAHEPRAQVRALVTL